MLQNNSIELFPTSRAIRVALEEYKQQNQILPKLATIGEFEQKAIIVPNRTFIDEDTRVLLLQKACSFEKFKKLNIPTEFFSFLKNSSFIFSFLDELSSEKKSIDELRLSDTYLEYEEHLEVLKFIKKNYIELLDQNNYCDKLLLPKLYELNEDYIKSFLNITLNLEGYMSDFELELFSKIAQITNLTINFLKTPFNKKMVEKLDVFDKSTLNITTFTKRTNPVMIESFKDEILQVGFIKAKVYQFLKEGIKPEDIAIVLPDKSFAKQLQTFDYEKNFNYAFGYDYTDSLSYKKLDAIYSFLTEPSIENKHRVKRYFDDINLLQNLKQKSHKELLESFNFEEDEIYHDELYLFKKLLPNLENLPFEKVLHLFLNRLSKRSIDDVRGGKITVLEVLETRGVSFEAVIIPNFNEGKVPKTLKKDMFISSSLRAKVGLPTATDRQNLQKQLYFFIIHRAKKVAISYIDNEQNAPSRVLDELELNLKREKKEPKSYNNLFFSSNKEVSYSSKDSIVLPYDFTKVELSASRLRAFLECPRRYFYKYIKKINDHEIPTDEINPNEIGNLLHIALKKIYEQKEFYHDEKDLIIDLQRELLKDVSDEVLKFHLELWLKRLHNFAKTEIERFASGFRVVEVEKNFKLKYKGFNLVGQIDRIDKKDNNFFVLDYKSGKITQPTSKSLEKSTNFQLQFYKLLTNATEALYYDLTNAKVIEENLFDEKLNLLDEILDSLKKQKEFDFYKTEEKKNCQYCPYKLMCGVML